MRRDKGRTLFKFLAGRTGKGRPSQLSRSGGLGWFVAFGTERALDDLPGVRRADGSAVGPGPFRGEVDAVSLEGGDARSAGIGRVSEYRQLVGDLAGIRVYRDGFGIRVGEDWLGLGRQWTGGGLLLRSQARECARVREDQRTGQSGPRGNDEPGRIPGDTALRELLGAAVGVCPVRRRHPGVPAARGRRFREGAPGPGRRGLIRTTTIRASRGGLAMSPGGSPRTGKLSSSARSALCGRLRTESRRRSATCAGSWNTSHQRTARCPGPSWSSKGKSRR